MHLGLFAVKPLILLIDDEPDLLSLLTETLQTALPEYSVAGVTTYDDALAALEGEVSDLRLVVVDQLLNGGTGLQLLGHLSDSRPAVPSILFTGQSTAELECDARTVGAQVLAKPVPLTTWLATVRSML